MKTVFKLITFVSLFLNLSNCNHKSENFFIDSGFWFLLYENNIYKNYCPDVNNNLDSGTHTITLDEGEEFWFDLVAERTYKSFYIGISTSSLEQTLTFFNDNCIYNYTVTKPRTITVDYEKTLQYEEDGFKYYSFYFYETSSRKLWLAAIKMASGSGEIKIKIP